MKEETYKKFFKIASIMLFLAILPLPYFYYELLRIIVFCSSLYAISRDLLVRNTNEKIYFIIIAILFNPVIPVYLSKMIWIPIDFTVGAFYLEYSKSYLELKKESS